MAEQETPESEGEKGDRPIDHVFTVKEVAERFRVSQGTIYADIRTGRLKALRFGRKTYRITEESLQDYLAAAQVSDSSRPKTNDRRQSRSHVATTFKHLDAARLTKAWSRPSRQRS
jgi:excisionase family DNA binding protein